MTVFKVSDSQMKAIMIAAQPLPVEKRDTFLRRVAAHLQVRGLGRQAGDADVDAAIRTSLAGLMHVPAA
jgi:hypothetical protein